MLERAWTAILVAGKAVAKTPLRLHTYRGTGNLQSVDWYADQELCRYRIRRIDGSSALETQATVRIQHRMKYLTHNAFRWFVEAPATIFLVNLAMLTTRTPNAGSSASDG